VQNCTSNHIDVQTAHAAKFFRNFLVAIVTMKSPTTDLLRGSYEEVGYVANKSEGSYEEIVPVEFGLYRARKGTYRKIRISCARDHDIKFFCMSSCAAEGGQISCVYVYVTLFNGKGQIRLCYPAL